MLNIKFGQTQLPIGLDISDLTLRAVQLTPRLTIQGISSLDMPTDVISEGEVLNEDKLKEALTKLFSHPQWGYFDSNEVIACLPETKTFIKLLQIEKSPNELAAIVGPEIEKHIPFSLEEIYYDWQIIRESARHYEILVGACPKKVVDKYVATLRKTKLNPIALEIEAMSIARALLQEEFPKFKGVGNNYLVIDIGAQRSGMFAYSMDTILFDISLPISNHAITQTIAQTLNLEKRQAEKAKIICGLDKSRANGIIYNVLQEMINNLIQRIKGGIEYYQLNFNKRGNLQKIILCGGGANIKGLPQIIQKAVSLPTERGNPFVHLASSAQDKKIIDFFTKTYKINPNFNHNKDTKHISATQDNSISYTTAIGLALRGAFIKQI